MSHVQMRFAIAVPLRRLRQLILHLRLMGKFRWSLYEASILRLYFPMQHSNITVGVI